MGKPPAKEQELLEKMAKIYKAMAEGKLDKETGKRIIIHIEKQLGLR